MSVDLIGMPRTSSSHLSRNRAAKIPKIGDIRVSLASHPKSTISSVIRAGTTVRHQGVITVGIRSDQEQHTIGRLIERYTEIKKETH